MRKRSSNEDILERHPLFIKNYYYSIFSGRAGELLNETDVKTGVLEVRSLDLALTVRYGKFLQTRIILS